MILMSVGGDDLGEAELNLPEIMAREIVSSALGLDLAHRDRLTHEGHHDFDILYSHGPVPLEVKTATDYDLRRLYAGFLKHGTEVPASGTCDWQLNLRGTADIRRLLKEQERLRIGLRALEEHGLTFLPRRARTPEEESTIEIFEELFPEVEAAWGWAYPRDTPKIHFVPASGGGAIGPEAVNMYLGQFLGDLSGRGALQKLMRAPSDRRHLFVWLESTLPVFWMSFCEDERPPGRPTLPPEVTDVWLAGYCRGVQIQAWYLPWDQEWRAVSRDFPVPGTAMMLGEDEEGAGR